MREIDGAILVRPTFTRLAVWSKVATDCGCKVMPGIPRDGLPDSSLAFKRFGYGFIGRRCERFDSDIFETRLLGKRWYCVRGAEAARMFYEPGRFTRRGALPSFALRLLQDEGSVATLDAEAHRQRKQMFLALMTPGHVDSLAGSAAEGLRRRAQQWRQGSRFRLHEVFRLVLCEAACAWIGIAAGEDDVQRLARQCGTMIDHEGSVGPPNWLARLERRRTEHFLRRQVEDLRAGRREVPPRSPIHAIGTHRDPDGSLLAPEIAAVELLNLLRPTIAIARFMAFAALALHRHPANAPRLAADDAYLESFVQEVRRFYPFFPAVAGIACVPFTWRGFAFGAGDRFILDLYGTDHDPRSWREAARFRPERFLGWEGDAFSMIPQGGGDYRQNHRCAGEWLTIRVMKAMLRTLVRDLHYEVPPQDLRVKLSRMPALPESGFVVVATP